MSYPFSTAPNPKFNFQDYARTAEQGHGYGSGYGTSGPADISAKTVVIGVITVTSLLVAAAVAAGVVITAKGNGAHSTTVVSPTTSMPTTQGTAAVTTNSVTTVVASNTATTAAVSSPVTSAAASESATTAAASNPITTAVISNPTTSAVTTQSAIPTTTVTQASTVSTPSITVACNSAYQAIANHSICITDSVDLQSSGIIASDKVIIVDKHNTYRRNPYPKMPPKYGSAMRKLVWDDNIAAIAQQFARSCPTDHEASSSQRQVIGYNVAIGQNLANGQTTWTEAIDDWFAESTSFVYGTGGTGGAITGHYTQIVYDETTKIGCGYAECDTGFGTYFICNYATIQYTSKIKTPFAEGTSCASCVSHCDNGLCDCNGLICDTGTTIALNTCTCQ